MGLSDDVIETAEPREKRILIVEDENNMRKSLIRLIRNSHISSRILWAEDGIDATAKLGSFTPDLIITDLNMPRMDGIEFINYVQKTERYVRTKIIVLTGLHRNDFRVMAAKEAQIHHIHFKPYDDELIHSIKEILEAM